MPTYPRETHEMVLNLHSKAFAYFGGVPKRMVYDNLKTVIDAIFMVKDRHLLALVITICLSR